MSLDHLWAGWRASYVTSMTGEEVAKAGDGEPVPVEDDGDACVFCRIIDSTEPEELLGIVGRTEHCVVVLNAYPYASGHLLVLPRRHIDELTGLEPDESADLWSACLAAVRALQSAYGPEGMNLGMNLGRAAGAGIPKHLHMHVVPRWVGDTNFMTATASVRVLPEALSASWQKIHRRVVAMSLPYEVHLDTIAEELDRFEAAAQGAMERPVPSCPDWKVWDLSVHVLGVLDRWTAQVIAADPTTRTDIERRIPADEDALLVDLEGSSSALIDAFIAAGPDAPCWSFSEDGRNTTWLARRVALELAVHRIDAELAIGPANPVERELAVEGIEERIAFFLRRAVTDAPDRSLSGSLCLVCEDAEAAWVVEVDPGELRWRKGRGPADAAVVGPASELFLFSWNRVPLERLGLTGDRAVAEGWRSLFG